MQSPHMLMNDNESMVSHSVKNEADKLCQWTKSTRYHEYLYCNCTFTQSNKMAECTIIRHNQNSIPVMTNMVF